MNLLIFLGLIALGYTTGRHFEKNHFKSLTEREEKVRHLPTISGEWKQFINDADQSELFGGGVVIGADYFKAVIAGLRSVFGGRMHSYESLLDRGRREALLRMQEKALKWGADKIINVRIETAVIGNQSGKQALPCVEVFAYGTGIKLNKNEI